METRDMFLAMCLLVSKTNNMSAMGISVATCLTKGLVRLALVLLLLPSAVTAQTRLLIMAEADAYVLEGLPDTSPSEEVPYILSSGIGSSGRSVSYVRFDLTGIPNSNFVRNISIDAGQVRLLAQSFGLARSEERFLFVVSYCDGSDWAESTMTWNSRSCRDGVDGEDSVIVDCKDLPQSYTWDVTRSVAEAKAKGGIEGHLCC